ncbi:hypothetical protein [Dictyobacter aurantiacus]|uniref:Uncharacterized protein n=1 Tax=Dictyobacter aurantiacus TaxID=1936993 RepID=A0A401ZI18_9CHLR|nr:hypothetical protein [Dictyobacter aurantiacus]GCE06484.1 hypothetical protein KDAU_38130 [Dictyobacter aurantiacus]
MLHLRLLQQKALNYRNLNYRKLNYRQLGLYTMVGLETLLVASALVPAQLWTRIFPLSANAALNGPYPASIAPMITLFLYLLPTVIGFSCQRWQKALLLATLPAWLGLGIFLVAATFKVGAFYVVSSDHITANVSLLELFAGLGAIGWLARFLIKMR